MTKWEEFGRWYFREMRTNGGGDIDGGAAQDKALELGLLQWVTVTEPCGEDCNCMLYGEFPQECLQPVELVEE